MRFYTAQGVERSSDMRPGSSFSTTAWRSTWRARPSTSPGSSNVSGQKDPDQDARGLSQKTIGYKTAVEDFFYFSIMDRDIRLLNYLDPTKTGLLTHLLNDGDPISTSYMNYDWSLNA
ncbi:uncharacterized protein [Zea mays]|uniref:uncharacterized protein n=1 Tax=Zea mays TaxID=4577 RepID=UPI0004DEB1DD|nr:uncharacterized protein LOC103626153 [Zea mays]|eukprot:XP_008644763.1 uncharacterized protein LOC103626153 [Zea mays]